MTNPPQKSSVKPWLTWEPGQPTGPQFGILSKLNGTWVNRKQMRTGASQRLRHLDEVEIGDTKLLFLGGKITGAPRRV